MRKEFTLRDIQYTGRQLLKEPEVRDGLGTLLPTFQEFCKTSEHHYYRIAKDLGLDQGKKGAYIGALGDGERRKFYWEIWTVLLGKAEIAIPGFQERVRTLLEEKRHRNRRERRMMRSRWKSGPSRLLATQVLLALIRLGSTPKRAYALEKLDNHIDQEFAEQLLTLLSTIDAFLETWGYDLGVVASSESHQRVREHNFSMHVRPLTPEQMQYALSELLKHRPQVLDTLLLQYDLVTLDAN